MLVHEVDYLAGLTCPPVSIIGSHRGPGTIQISMTFEIALVLTILLVALVLFVTEWIPMDVTALLVLGTLALTRTG